MIGKVSPIAGKIAPPTLLINVSKLINAYHTEVPDPSIARERVVFGTSGHRGSSLEKTFNELKQEKNQLLLTKMDGDQDDERHNLVRQLTQEKVRRIFFLIFFSIISFLFSRISMNNNPKNFENKLNK